MSNIKKLMMTAAGGAALNVEEVFSTYLHTGNDDKQGIPNGIALADGVGGGTSTEFDGVSDFLSRSSDLTGNADGKTFTLSCWVYRTGAVPLRAVYPFRYQGYFQLEVGTNGAINVGGANTSGSTILEATLPSKTVPLKVWTHILVSVDLSNTSNRHIYLNDVAASPTWVTYSNQDIDFTRTTSHINSNSVGSFGSARHAHIYLDYTYRDLSVTSNRRYFIDANGGSTSPSTLSALNPIVYLPMTSAYSIGENLGTGGDYTVNGSPKVVQSGTEYLSDYGKGGLVWLKSRGFTNTNTNLTGSHALIDTERGNTSRLLSNTTDAAQSDGSNYVNSFNSDGFTVGTTMSNGFDGGHRYASWTFRKAPKFFDVVTYTGTGSAQTISHNLGTTPAVVIVKMTSNIGGWFVYHSSVGATKYLRLETTGAAITNSTIWNDTAPTDTQFTVGTSGGVNQSGGTYVAYLFAHNDGDGDFGPTGDQDIIKCGSYTGNGQNYLTGGNTIDIGFEPQWIMIQPATVSGYGAYIYDTMRGIVEGNVAQDFDLQPSSTAAEASYGARIAVTSTGFKLETSGGAVNESGQTYIYIAIRRGPMALPESGDDVFQTATRDATRPAFDSGWPVDMAVYYNNISTAHSKYLGSRMQGNLIMSPNSANAVQDLSAFRWDYMDGYYETTGTSSIYISHMWRRYPQCFDIVCYTGNGTTGRTVDHNLEVAPEMMWVKRTDTSGNWQVYHSSQGAGKYSPSFRTDPFYISSARWNNTTPTSSVFTLGGDSDVNASGGKYIAYLFSTLSGITKVGSYSGTGSNINVDCGFSNGAKFIMIKRADTEIQSTTHWYVWDSLHGIVAGNDPYLMWNNVTAQVTNTDYIDPLSSGFTVTSSANSGLNASGGTYIYYAVAA